MKELLQILSKPIGAMGDYIALRMFGKPTAVLKAEIENETKRVAQLGDIQREVQAPFLLKMEQQKAERQFGNLFTTLARTEPLIGEGEQKPISDDNDFFWGMIEHAKDVSNDEMQDLIAKILAGEYNDPGTYSISTLQVLKSLGKTELLLFEKLCGYIIDGYHIPHEMFNGGQKAGFLFTDFQTLQSLGLVLPQPMVTNYNRLSMRVGDSIIFSYFDKSLKFVIEHPTLLTSPQYYGLTPAGTQIKKHLNVKEAYGFFEWLKSNFVMLGARFVGADESTSQIRYKG